MILLFPGYFGSDLGFLIFIVPDLFKAIFLGFGWLNRILGKTISNVIYKKVFMIL